MFYHNINPVLLDLGPVEIRYYGLVYALGFLLVYFMLMKVAEHGKIKGFSREKAESLMLYLFVGVILGGRLGYFLFYNISYFWKDPLEILMIWHGGMAFHGALIGKLTALYLFRKRHGIGFYELADIIVIPTAFMLFLGRITNLINGELWGRVTEVPWCIDYSKSQYIPNPPEGCRHPSQVYEALKNLIIFGVLLAMHLHKKLRKGTLFWTFITIYGVLRFIVTFSREFDPTDIGFLGLSIGQYLSLAMFLTGAVVLWKRKVQA